MAGRGAAREQQAIEAPVGHALAVKAPAGIELAPPSISKKRRITGKSQPLATRTHCSRYDVLTNFADVRPDVKDHTHADSDKAVIDSPSIVTTHVETQCNDITVSIQPCPDRAKDNPIHAMNSKSALGERNDVV